MDLEICICNEIPEKAVYDSDGKKHVTLLRDKSCPVHGEKSE